MTELINLIDIKLQFNKNNISILGKTDHPLCVVSDICTILGLTNPTSVLRNIPDRWKTLLKLRTGLFILY
jgi:prophage antirepressor-like protein